jgi:hypothetical protein
MVTEQSISVDAIDDTIHNTRTRCLGDLRCGASTVMAQLVVLLKELGHDVEAVWPDRRKVGA